MSSWNQAASSVLIVSIAASCASAPRIEQRNLRELPESLRQAGTRVGLDYASHWIALEVDAFGAVTDVEFSTRGARVIGTWGVWDSGEVDGTPSWVRFDHPADWTVPYDMQAIDAPGSSAAAYMNRGGNWHPVGTFDATGAALWRSEGHPATNRLAAGDLDGDDRIDLVVGFNGDGGLARLTETGDRVWSVAGRNVWAVELIDLDRDGRPEIVHSERGSLVVRNAEGAILSTHPRAGCFGGFAVEGDPRAHAAPRIVCAARDEVVLVDLTTGENKGLSTDHPVWLAELSALRATIDPANGPVHAILANFPLHERSVLAVYDRAGALLHETVLPFSCSALEGDTWDPEGDVLVLGCERRVVLFGREIPLQRRALAVRTAFYGRRNPAVAEEERSLAWAYYASGRPEEGEPHARRAIEIVETKYGRDAPETAGFLETLGLVLEATGHRDEAERLFLHSLSLSTPPNAPNHENLWAVHFSLGGFYHAGERADLAERHYAAALATLPEGDPSTSRTRAQIAYSLARLLHANGRHDEALRAIRLAIEHDVRAHGSGHPEVERDRTLETRIRSALPDRGEVPANVEAE